MHAQFILFCRDYMAALTSAEETFQMYYGTCECVCVCVYVYFLCCVCV